MIWNKNLETGVAKIDEEHKELYRRLEMMTDPANANKADQMIKFMSDYVVKHFTDEQAIHAGSAYPKAGIHKGYHEAFIKALDDKIKEYRSAEGNRLTEAKTAMQINSLVVNWLTQHILVHDMEFAKYYKEKNK
ncbi:MAG: hemerythrin domain-containing protein [Clostridiales bacterium]|jgi:hemerythrin|nr:hemerythrin domain-containing protein [Clostridiales bacterium]